ncbi:MAG TPA: hypothetical protein VGG75_13600 [Trebonia sp.]|jgi:hypothetical protein
MSMSHKAAYDFFPPEAVDEWVRTKLATYFRATDVASLNLGESEVAPAVLIKFAELAKTMGLLIRTNYQTLYIRQPRSLQDQRDSAIGEMRMAYERGEIDAFGHTPDDNRDKSQD